MFNFGAVHARCNGRWSMGTFGASGAKDQLKLKNLAIGREIYKCKKLLYCIGAELVWIDYEIYKYIIKALNINTK